MTNPLIHLVDDDDAVRRSLALLVGTVGLSVAEWPHPQAFLDGFDRESVGAIVLDVRMPGISGLTVLDTLTGAGFLPVVACVAGDRQGNVYNVNADQMAVACATGYGAERLLFLTDVEGVRDGSGATLSVLTAGGAQGLIASGAATGGMQAKLNSACAALAGGVKEVVIAPGAAAGIIGRLLAGEGVGTRIIADGEGAG